MFFLNTERIFCDFFNSSCEKRVDHTHGDDRLEIGLCVQGLFFATKMDGEVWQLKDRFFGVPIAALKFIAFDLNDDSSGKSKVSIKPRPPKTPSVSHNIELVIATCLEFTEGSKFEDWGVSVTADNLEGSNCLLVA